MSFQAYLENVVQKRFEEMAKPQRFPAPKGFKKVYTGGNIYMYAGKLPNGKYVELFGDDDIQEHEDGFNVVAKDDQDKNLAKLYDSKDDSQHSALKQKTFATETELKAILDSWSK